MRSIIIKTLVSAGTLSLLLISQGYAGPQDDGLWSEPFDWPISVRHSLLTPQGNILSIGPTAPNYSFDIWNPELGTGADSHVRAADTFPTDSLLGSAVLMPGTNSVLITGADDNSSGDNATYLFNTETNRLTRGANMSAFRIFSKAITLPSGEIMVNGAGGFRTEQQDQIPEIYSPATNQWRLLSDAARPGIAGSGPGVLNEWVKPDGDVFSFARNISTSTGAGMFTIDTAGSGSLTPLKNSSSSSYFAGDSVMYRPGMLFHPRPTNSDLTVSFVTNLNGSAPFFREAGVPRPYGVENTRSSTSIMLPNGKVMFISLLSTLRDKDGLEIWDPSTEGWSSMATVAPNAQFARLASIILLKDGRVLAPNMNFSGGDRSSAQAGSIFSPPYLFNSSGQLASRPSIVSAPSSASYGGQETVTHSPGNVISRVTLIKSGRIDPLGDFPGEAIGQRFIELDFDDLSNGVSVKMPSSANIAPPGHYVMYLLDNKGVPSKGHIIQISGSTTDNGAYPTATADSVSVNGSGSITIDALANDNGNGLLLNTPNAWSLKGGTVALVNNKITYKPKLGFNGTDKIWYVLRDNLGRTNSGTITITVSGNTGTTSPYPTAIQDNVTVVTATQTTIDVLANDKGTGLTLNAPNVWSLNGGRVSLVSNKLVYTSKTGFTGSDKIWYTFKDSQSRSNSGQVNITVQGNTSTAFPVAKADYYSTAKNTGKNLNILAKDTGSVWVAIDTLYQYTAKGGTTYKTPEGQVWYRPKTGFTGEDNFWYVMIDSKGRKNSAQVKINVKP